jgi:hypothetical protein
MRKKSVTYKYNVGHKLFQVEQTAGTASNRGKFSHAIKKKITELSLRLPPFYKNFKHRVFQPKRIQTNYFPKKVQQTQTSKTTHLEELPFHRKLGFSPVFFTALCVTFLILLWFMLFSPH